MFNGNISSMLVNIPQLGDAHLYGYAYDQLNRIVGMNAYTGMNNSTGALVPVAAAGNAYKERVSYDGNGNILSYKRNGESATAAMDDLTYKYFESGGGKLRNNRLRLVEDAVSDGNYTIDIDDQLAAVGNNAADSNYVYDAIGNLVVDKSEKIASIEWNVYGKIGQIVKTGDLSNTTIRYTYDASGNRISKSVQVGAGTPQVTWYVRDASGNVMAIYEKDNVATNDGELTQIEIPLYGSSRLGMWRPLRPLEGENWEFFETTPAPGTSGVRPEEFVRGRTQYELSNHLGNVQVTISDNRIPVDNGTYSVMTVCPSCLPGYPCIPCYNHYERDSDTEDGIVDHYTAHVLTANDYYPFGMGMPGRVHRSLGVGGYRYGFNGKENDNDVKGEGNQQDYGLRIYDPRLGRFLSVDPLTSDYPWYTPYQFAGNDVIRNIDLDGGEPKPASSPNDREGDQKTTEESKVDNCARCNGGRVVTIRQNWIYHEGGVNGSEAGWKKDAEYFEDVLKPLAEDYGSGNITSTWNFATSRKDYLIEAASGSGKGFGVAMQFDGLVANVAKYMKENPTVDNWERWVPIWGSWKQAYLDFSVGKWGSGTFNSLLGVSDVFLIKSVFQAPLKAVMNEGLSGGFRKYFGIGMSHEWGATVKRWKGLGIDVTGYKHHWLISQELMERYTWLKPIGNQQWNITRFSTQANHMRWGHFQAYPSLQLGRVPFARGLYPISSTPTWIKLTGTSTGGRLF